MPIRRATFATDDVTITAEKQPNGWFISSVKSTC